MRSRFVRFSLLSVMLLAASHGYAGPRDYVITLRVTALFQAPSPNCTPTATFRTFGCSNAIGDIHVGRFTIDDSLLQQTGDNLPGTVTNFFLEISPVTWNQEFPSPITDFTAFGGPITGQVCQPPRGCFNAPSPGFNVQNGTITGLQGVVLGPLAFAGFDDPFVEFRGTSFFARDLVNGGTQGGTQMIGTLQVTPVTTLDAIPASSSPGGIVTAAWTGIASPTPTDWVGLFQAGAANTVFIDWAYVNCSKTPGSPRGSGSCAFVLPGNLALGTYQFRLFSNNGFTLLATSNNFLVNITFTASPASIPAGGTMTVSWSGISQSPLDWIGLFIPGALPTQYIDWMYVNSCSKAPGGVVQTSGSCPFLLSSALQPGTYQMRFLSNNGFTVIATSNNFMVTSFMIR